MVQLNMSMVNQVLDDPIVQGVLVVIILAAITAIYYFMRDRLRRTWQIAIDMNTSVGRVPSLERDTGNIKKDIENIKDDIKKIENIKSDTENIKNDIENIKIDMENIKNDISNGSVQFRIKATHEDVKRIVQDLKSFINESSKEYYIIHDRYKNAECADCKQVNERFLMLKQKAEVLVAALEREPK